MSAIDPTSSGHGDHSPRRAASPGRISLGGVAAVGLRPLAAGLAGGLIVAVILTALIASGVIAGETTRVVEPASAPVARDHGANLDAEQIYSADAPGVAFVRSIGVTSETPLGPAEGTATGSGFLVDRNGDVLTNAHVVAGADRVTVRVGAGGGAIPAEVVGTDVSNDLAVLRVDPAKTDADPLPLGDSSSVHVGDSVVAIGNPFGLDRTITSGIVSALQRQIRAPDGFAIRNVIQTDAAINPGNSGGPLIDSKGQVIGINSQIETGGSGNANVGIGFAISIDTAKSELETLEGGGTVEHPFLGVATAPLSRDVATAMGLDPGQRGALVQEVTEGSPAAEAGIRAGSERTMGGIVVGGDVIVSVEGRDIATPNQLSRAVATMRAGDQVTIGYLRGGSPHTAEITLGTRPQQ